MNRESVHRKIRELVQLIELNNNRLFLQDEPLSSFDSDYLKQLTLALYQQIELLGEAGEETESKNETVETKVERQREETTTIVVPEIDIPEVADEQPEPANQEPETPVSQSKEDDTPVEEEIVQEIDEVAKQEPEAEPETKHIEELAKENVQIPKMPSTEVPKTTQKNETDNGDSTRRHVYDRLKNSKIESVKKAISISKRYEFQSVLFSKDPEVYDTNIKKLDSASSLEEAYERFDAMAEEFNWNLESELVEELQTILLRRYM